MLVKMGRTWITPEKTEISAATLEKSWAISLKTNMKLPHNPSVDFLSIYYKEMKTYSYLKIYVCMFIAVLFVTVKCWK